MDFKPLPIGVDNLKEIYKQNVLQYFATHFVLGNTIRNNYP